MTDVQCTHCVWFTRTHTFCNSYQPTSKSVTSKYFISTLLTQRITLIIKLYTRFYGSHFVPATKKCYTLKQIRSHNIHRFWHILGFNSSKLIADSHCYVCTYLSHTVVISVIHRVFYILPLPFAVPRGGVTGRPAFSPPYGNFFLSAGFNICTNIQQQNNRLGYQNLKKTSTGLTSFQYNLRT